MGKKDITEKKLESFADLFADIVNVLVFQGEQRINPDQLVDVLPRAIYKAGGNLHEQERDTAKRWVDGETTFVLLGIENQSVSEKLMPLRVMSYDGANYRDQINERDRIIRRNRRLTKTSRKPVPAIYPVITLVLYFGLSRWTYGRNLCDSIEVSIAPEMKAMVSDYHINLFEIAFLSDEQVNLFRSDFKIVADYFVKARKIREGLLKDYVPTAETISHVREVLELMSVMTGDNRFEDAYNTRHPREEMNKMCEILDAVEERGIKKGIERGIERGIEQGIKRGIEQGIERGIEQGIERGVEKGEKRLFTLMIKMNEAGESFDIIRLQTDEKALKALYKKYNID